MLKTMKRLAWLVAVLLASGTAQALPVVLGTNGNNFLTMQGSTQTVNQSVANPYSGETLSFNGSYFVNQAVYDGLNGTDFLLATNASDWLSLNDGLGAPTLLSIETVFMGDGDDFANLADPLIQLPDQTLDGGAGNDVLWANSGRDTVNARDGNDILNAGPGNDRLNGMNGDDLFVLFLGAGMDTVNGGDGVDTIWFTGGIAWEDLSLELNTNLFPVTFVGDTVFGYGSDLVDLNSVEFLRFDDGRVIDLNALPAVVPEPGSLVLAGLALGAMALARRRSGGVVLRRQGADRF